MDLKETPSVGTNQSQMHQIHHETVQVRDRWKVRIRPPYRVRVGESEREGPST